MNTMDNTSVVPRLMSLHFLRKITNDFSKDRKVGSGSFGSVYKGEQKNGETIAVKVLHCIPQLADEEFEKEYLNIASLQHQNVVRLIGYCHETQREFQQFNGKTVSVEVTKRALCFDYMHNGSLDKYLDDEFSGYGWHIRYAIIKGICKGLKYLHEELQPPMYHLDLKPGNVLLDVDMVPKLADFGLSRLFGGEKTQITKSTIGTIGYVPPEYINAGIISNKFDVFSLGVVIIKIMTGRLGYSRIDEMAPREFIELVHANWTKRLHGESVCLLDSYSEQVKRCIEIALSCVEVDRHERLTIGVVVSKLNATAIMMQICHCISTETELMDAPLKKLISYPLSITDNRGRLHETIISTICLLEDDASNFEPIRPKIKIIKRPAGFGPTYTTDVHPTEPWILLGHLNHVCVWNHQTQARLMAFCIHNKKEFSITAVRFIARKQWFFAGDYEGKIHVYSYTTKYELKKFTAHGHGHGVYSLAVHPTDPFVLSSSDGGQIKLWNWENDWECVRTFKANDQGETSVKFNPQTAGNTFASASRDGTVKMWSILSDTPITTLECGTDGKTTVHYFAVPGFREYIVVGSIRGTAQIWDLETKTCIRHVNGLQELWCPVAVLDCLPGHPILVTVSKDHIVSFCNSTTHRYQNMIDFKLGYIKDFAYNKATRSLVVSCLQGFAIMEIS